MCVCVCVCLFALMGETEVLVDLSVVERGEGASSWSAVPAVPLPFHTHKQGLCGVCAHTYTHTHTHMYTHTNTCRSAVSDRQTHTNTPPEWEAVVVPALRRQIEDTEGLMVQCRSPLCLWCTLLWWSAESQ